MSLTDSMKGTRGTVFCKYRKKKGRDAYGEKLETGGIIKRRDVPGGIRRGRTLEDPAWRHAETGEIIPAGDF